MRGRRTKIKRIFTCLKNEFLKSYRILLEIILICTSKDNELECQK